MPDPAGCQVIDRVHDAKNVISRDLDVIRDRLGRPVPREVIDRSDPTARHGYATAYVDHKLDAGHCRGVDRDVYVGLVDDHLTPLPEDREWLRRHTISSSARRHTAHHERHQDHRAPDPLQPLVEVLERQQAAARSAALYAAWAELNGVGLAGAGEDGDIVTETLAADLPDPDDDTDTSA
jgi:hypothetical protein